MWLVFRLILAAVLTVAYGASILASAVLALLGVPAALEIVLNLLNWPVLLALIVIIALISIPDRLSELANATGSIRTPVFGWDRRQAPPPEEASPIPLVDEQTREKLESAPPKDTEAAERFVNLATSIVELEESEAEHWWQRYLAEFLQAHSKQLLFRLASN